MNKLIIWIKNIQKFIKIIFGVNGFLFISLLIVFTSIFIFTDVPEILPWWAKLYDIVFFNLALSYIAGYIIWFLTSFLPNYRDKRKLDDYEMVLLTKVFKSWEAIMNCLIWPKKFWNDFNISWKSQ